MLKPKLTEAPEMPEIDDTQNEMAYDGDYVELKRVLVRAYDQAAFGKGKERHANSKPFTDQPILAIPAILTEIAGLGGLIYQVCKKSQEAVGMAKRKAYGAAKRELLGAINYLAAAYIHLERMEMQASPENGEEQ